MFGLIVMTKRERSVHLHGQSLWLLSNLNVLADYISADNPNPTLRMLETHQTHHVKLFNPIIVIYIRDYLI